MIDGWICEFQIWRADCMSKWIKPSSDILVISLYMLKFLLTRHCLAIKLLLYSAAPRWLALLFDAYLFPRPSKLSFLLCTPDLWTSEFCHLTWIMAQCIPSSLHTVISLTMAGPVYPFPQPAFTSDTYLILCLYHVQLFLCSLDLDLKVVCDLHHIWQMFTK